MVFWRKFLNYKLNSKGYKSTWSISTKGIVAKSIAIIIIDTRTKHMKI